MRSATFAEFRPETEVHSNHSPRPSSKTYIIHLVKRWRKRFQKLPLINTHSESPFPFADFKLMRKLILKCSQLPETRLSFRPVSIWRMRKPIFYASRMRKPGLNDSKTTKTYSKLTLFSANFKLAGEKTGFSGFMTDWMLLVTKMRSFKIGFLQYQFQTDARENRFHLRSRNQNLY